MKQDNFLPSNYDTTLLAALDINKEFALSEAMLERVKWIHQAYVKEDFESTRKTWEELLTQQAYALYFMTANLSKFDFVYSRSPQFIDGLAKEKYLVIRENGCGPGTAIWGLLFYLKLHKPEFLLNIKKIIFCDQSAASVQMAETLATKFLPEYFPELDAKLIFKIQDWRQREDGKGQIDFEIFANTCVENEFDAKFFTAQKAQHMLFLEPGTKSSFQGLLPIRAELMKNEWDTHFPCLQSAQCPFSQNDNWCHFNVNKLSSPLVQAIANRSGMARSRHYFSAFLFSRNTKYTVAPEQVRLLSGLKKASGSSIRLVCDGSRVREIVLNKKARAEGNSTFRDAAAGETLSFANSEDLAKAMQKKRIDSTMALKKP